MTKAHVLKQACRSLLFILLCTGLMLVRAEAARGADDITGLWTFKLSLLEDFDDDSATTGTETLVSVWLIQNGNTVFGTGGQEYFMGSRSGLDLSLEILSKGSSDSDAQNGGIEQVCTMSLRLTNRDTLIGRAVGLTPADGMNAFEMFRVTAKRVAGATVAEADSSIPSWICDAFTSIIQDILSAETAGLLAPMSACDPSKNGGGYYFFGHMGPGGGRKFATTTFYIPFEWAACSTRTYDFTIQAKDAFLSLSELKSIINDAKELGDFLHIDLSSLINEVESFYNTYGNFAVSLGISAHTENVSVYVNTSDDTSQDVCNNIINTELIQTVREIAGDLGHDVDVFCGHDIHDTWSLVRSPVPLPTMVCNSPVVYIYLLGTINVNFD